MFAQSVVEYGVLAAVGNGINRLMYSISDLIVSADPQTWYIAAAVLLVVLIVLNKRAPR
jgi:hypothetical protein